MKRAAGFRVVAALAVACLCGASARAQEKEVPKVEVGEQYSSLSVNYPEDSAGTAYDIGFGGRVTFNLNSRVAVEAELNFFRSNIGQTISAGGRAVQGQFGLKAGKRFAHFGLFAKARPGFVSFAGTQKLSLGQESFGGFSFPVVNFDTARTTHFSMDLGGVLEFYPSRRVVTRFDVGDTVIHYGPRNDFSPTPDELLAEVPSETKHNFQFTAGIAYRFGGGDKSGKGGDGGAARASAGGGKTPRLEVGAQFTSLLLEPTLVSNGFGFFFPDNGGSVNPESGFGGRVTYNLNSHLGLEAEANLYPRRSFPDSTTGGLPAQAQFGAKAGWRWKRLGLFAKARPGFVSFSEVTQLVATQVLTFQMPFQQFTVGTFRDKRKTYFSTDVGGVLELYPSRRLVTRFDFGDTVIRYGARQQPGFLLSRAIVRLAPETKHNFQLSAGVGWRF